MQFLRRLIWRVIGAQSSELARKVISGSIWQLFARMLMRAVNLIVFMVVVRVLKPDEVGVANAATIVISWAYGLSQLGLEAQVIRMGDRAEEYLPTTFFVRILRSFLIGAIICGTAWWTADLLRAPDSAPLIFVLGVNFALGGIANAATVLLNRDLEVKNLALRSAFDTYVSAVVTIGVVLIFRTYWAIPLGTLATTISGVINSYLVTPKRVRPAFNWERFKELYSYGRWITLGHMANFITANIEGPLVSRLGGVHQLGLYVQAQRFAALPGQELGAAVAATLFAGVSKIRQDQRKLQSALEQVIVTVTKLLVPACLFMGIFGVPLVRIILTDAYVEAAPVFMVFVLFTTLLPITITGGTFLNAMGLPQVDLLALLIRFTVFVSAVIPMFRAMGITGLALTACIAGSIGSLFSYFVMCRKMPFPAFAGLFYLVRQALVPLTLAGGAWLLARQLENPFLQVLAGLPFFLAAQFFAIKTAKLSLPWNLDRQLEQTPPQ